MQNNNILNKEVLKNSESVFMSDMLSNLIENSDSKNDHKVKCFIKTNNNTIEKTLISKEEIEDLILITFICQAKDLLNLEKDIIESIEIFLLDSKINMFNSLNNRFDLCWKCLDNNYYIDIFINKRGVENGI
tara:strand:+ start:6998 stop:7393 length:396 start_codon:yes stop_codon:yes gene_type:complete